MGKFKKDKKIKNSNNEIKSDIYRTKSERIDAVKPIIEKLNELHLTIQYEPIKQLFSLIQQYINEGKEIIINIPFPIINKRIKGVLCDNIRHQVWVKLEDEKF